MIGSDSAPLHVAASVNTPFVGLFGPTNPKKHLAPTEKSVVFKKDFKCSPCYKTHCSRDYKCMKSIKPDEVYLAVVKLLGIKTGSLRGGRRDSFACHCEAPKAPK